MNEKMSRMIPGIIIPQMRLRIPSTRSATAISFIGVPLFEIEIDSDSNDYESENHASGKNKTENSQNNHDYCKYLHALTPPQIVAC